MILHITTRARWQHALEVGAYEAPTLGEEGFMHLSAPHQVVKVANERFLDAEEELVLLHVDPDKITAPLKYEVGGPDGEEFPHVFGALNLDAVVEILPFAEQTGGGFALPPSLA